MSLWLALSRSLVLDSMTAFRASLAFLSRAGAECCAWEEEGRRGVRIVLVFVRFLVSEGWRKRETCRPLASWCLAADEVAHVSSYEDACRAGDDVVAIGESRHLAQLSKLSSFIPSSSSFFFLLPFSSLLCFCFDPPPPLDPPPLPPLFGFGGKSLGSSCSTPHPTHSHHTPTRHSAVPQTSTISTPGNTWLSRNTR